jgi:hypothetical protein
MKRRLGIVLVLIAVIAGAWQLYIFAQGTRTAEQTGPLLSGVVRTASGEPLEGVTISVRRDRTPVTISVFTDAQGGYYLPPLTAGSYRVRAQAPGFQKNEATVTLSHGGPVRQDFKIGQARDSFLHLTGYEQFATLPEDTPARRRMKDVFLRNCTGCHTTNVALQNRFDQRGWEAIIDAMSRLAAGGEFSNPSQPPNRALTYFKKDLAAYLAEMRGPASSSAAASLPPRPSGEATLRSSMNTTCRSSQARATFPTTAATGRSVRCQVAAEALACTTPNPTRMETCGCPITPTGRRRERSRRSMPIPARSRSTATRDRMDAPVTLTESRWPATAWCGSRSV